MVGRGTRVVGTLAAASAVLLGSVAAAPSSVAAVVASGSGSSSAATILNQWVGDADAHGLQVVYTASGSSQGRRDFAQLSTDFGVTDLPYQGGDDVSSRPYAYVPLVAEGLAFPYHLEVGGERVNNLRLSGQTIARIFTGDITSWDDPAIAADNNGRILPATPIRPVVRSDGSGTTEVLTDYLADRFPELWGPCNGGAAEPTAYFPLHCGQDAGADVGAAGADGAMNRIKGFFGDGAIGYVPNTYVTWPDYPVADVENAAGYFVPPTQYGVSLALAHAQVGDDQVADLSGVRVAADPRSYPFSYYEYGVVPTSPGDTGMTTAKRQALVDFLSYAACAGQTSAGVLGYAPLPANLATEALTQVARVAAGDEDVDLTGRADCDTPDVGEIAPQPQACQQSSAGPCGTSGPPTNIVAPVVGGAVRVGATVQADPGLWSGEEGLDYQWLADGKAIAGATGATYRVPAALLGSSLSVRVTAFSSDFPSSTIQSAAKAVARGRLHGSRVTIAGRAVVGRTLAVRGARISGARLRVQWYAAGHRIPGATSLRWTLRRAQVGKRVSVRVVATAPAYDALVRRAATGRPVRASG